MEAHQETIALFEQAARSATDADVKDFAAKTLPTLRHHLTLAMEVDQSAHDNAAVGTTAQ